MRHNLFLASLLSGVVFSCTALAQPLSTSFTFQGELTSTGTPVTGAYDFRFLLFDNVSAGTQVGSTLCVDNAAVAGGRFTVQLDFGSQFSGQQRFLEIQVRQDTGLSCANATGFTTLSPRQSLTAAPNAVFSLNAASATSAATATTATTATTAANATQLNGQAATFYQNAANISSGVLGSARLSGAYSNALTLSNPTNAFSGSGAGLTSVNADLLDGLDSTAFLQSIPVPLTLSASINSSHVIRGENASPTSFASGVLGVASAISGSTMGVEGASSSSDGTGVYGQATSSSGTTYGGAFVSVSPSGYGARGTGAVGLLGDSSATSGRGVWGLSSNATGRGVFGQASATSGLSYGVYGQAASSTDSATGVFGSATAFSGITFGVRGESNSPTGIGVYGISGALTGSASGVEGWSNGNAGRGVSGISSSSTGWTYGVYGESNSTSDNSAGLFGTALGVSGITFGVRGESSSPTGFGVFGYSSLASGATTGVYGRADSTTGRGSVGVAVTVTGVNYGLLGTTNSPNGWGVFSVGNSGASGIKPFRIDHPQDPTNKYLLHYSAESPQPQNFYNGIAPLDDRGEATIALPAYFAAINKDPCYTLTAIGSAMPLLHIAEEIDPAALSTGARIEPGQPVPPCMFRVAGGAPGGKVSWRIDAVRNDRWVQRHGAPVEVEKESPEKGTYQHPDLYNQPLEKSMNYQPNPQTAPTTAPSPR